MKKWIRKSSYLLILVGMGVVYLSCVDKWQVYAEPMAKMQAIYARIVNGEETGALLAGTGKGAGASLEGSGAQPHGSGEGGNGNAGGAGSVTAGDGGIGNGGSAGAGTQGGNVGGPGSVTEGDGGIGNGGNAGAGTQGGNAGDPGNGTAGDGGAGNGGNAGNGTQGAGNTGDGTPAGGAVTGTGESTEVPDFSWQPENSAPVYKAVEDDYFADAVFIGDSRTVGMFEYGGLEEISTFYASTGLTVYKLFDSKIVSVPGQRKKISVEEALQQNSFQKIYLMIGINEMGTGTVDSFIEKYWEVLDHLKELQPEAIIYVQAIIKVTTERSNQGDYINNEGIDARNARLSEMADNERVFYLDVNPEICDETGGMIADYTFDGVHLKAKYIEIWKNFLKSHAIEVNADSIPEN